MLIETNDLGDEHGVAFESSKACVETSLCMNSQESLFKNERADSCSFERDSFKLPLSLF